MALPTKSDKPKSKGDGTRKKSRIKPASKLPDDGYVRAGQLANGIFPFSIHTLRRMVKKGTFPAPVKLSDNILGWKVEDVRAWMDDKNKA